MSVDRELTDMQTLFVKHYLVTLNGAEAARLAGYSPKTAQVQGAALLGTPHVAKAIQKGMERKVKRIKIKEKDVIEELAYIAFSDALDITDKAQQAILNNLPLHEIETSDIGGTRSIREIVVTETKAGKKNIRIKLHDKMKALELLGKHLGMFSDKLEVSGEVRHTNEQKYHVIQEILTEPEIVERVRKNFRSRSRTPSS